jgi:uncharacterized membrane protein
MAPLGSRKPGRKEPEMFGLTPLGTVHTGVAVIAVVAALIAFARDKEIRAATMLGKVYVAATIVTCLTSLGIFRHGRFGAAHLLAIVTLATIGVAVLAARTRVFGRASADVETVSYSATFLFQLIPGITETSTRFPLGAPLVASPAAPALRIATGVLLLAFIVACVIQLRYLRARRASVA